MKRLLSLCWFASFAAFAASTTPTAGLTPVSNLSAAQVVERNVAARGGLEAWRAVGSMTMTGDMDAGGKVNPKLPFTLTMKRPNKTRLEIQVQGSAAVQVYDGTQGWKVRPFLGRNDAEAFSAAEVRSAAAAAELDGPLIDYARKGSKVELLGMEQVEGKNAYKLKLTRKGGEQLDVWLDATSYLELKIDGEPRRLDGRMHKVSVFYRDYKPVNGLMVPYTFETAVEGVKQTYKMNVKSVALNPPLTDLSFAKPQPAVANSPAS